MKVQDLREEMEQAGNPYLLVDVREADEIMEEPFSVGEHPHVLPIPLTSLMVLPKEEVTARLEDAARRIGRPVGELLIVTACRSGNRSRLAAERLGSLGITADNLEGGRIAWGEPLQEKIFQ